MSRHQLHRTKSSKAENSVRAFNISSPLVQQVEQAPAFRRPPAQYNHSASHGLAPRPNSDTEVPITPLSPLRVTRAPNLKEVKDWNKSHHRRSPSRQESFHQRLNNTFDIRDGPFKRETNLFDTFRTPKKDEERDSSSVYSREPSPVTTTPQKVPSTKRYLILVCIMTILGCLAFTALALSIAALLKAETAHGQLSTNTTSTIQSTTPPASLSSETTTTQTVDDLTSTLPTTPTPPNIASLSQPTHRTSPQKSTYTQTSTQIIHVTAPPDKRDKPLITSSVDCDSTITITTTLTTTLTSPNHLPLPPITSSTTSTTQHLLTSPSPLLSSSSSFAQRRYHAPFAWASMKKWLRNTQAEERGRVRVVSVADVMPMATVAEEVEVVEQILSTASANAA